MPQSQNQTFNQPSNNSGLAPMEIDRFEKGKNKGKSKGKTLKGKETTKGEGKNKSDKGKGKSNNKGSTRTATASDQCLYCGKYGHFKRDCWKLHGRGDQKNVNYRLNPMLRTMQPAPQATLRLPVVLLALLV